MRSAVARLKLWCNLIVNRPHSLTGHTAIRQAVKKPFFHLNFPYFPIATTQIEPFKKAVFLGCTFSGHANLADTIS